MKTKLFVTICWFVFLVSVVACESLPRLGLPEPTATNAAVSTPLSVNETAVPSPPPEQQQIPESLLNNISEFRNQVIGITLLYPTVWIIDYNEHFRSVSLYPDIFDEDSDIFIRTDNSLGLTPAAYLNVAEKSLIEESFLPTDAEQVGRIELFSIFDQPGAATEYKGELSDGTAVTFLLTTIINGDQAAIVFASVVDLRSMEAVRNDYRNVVSTIRLTEPVPAVPFFYVDEYAPARDVADDVAAAMALAREANKRILLIVGEETCDECQQLDEFIFTYQTVFEAFQNEFVIVKVEATSNQEFLAQYPSVEAIPHLFFLENDGSLLLSFDPQEIRVSETYDEVRFFLLWQEWHRDALKPVPDLRYLVGQYDPERDPVADLTTAIAQAQLQNKQILIIVGIPGCEWCRILDEFFQHHPDVTDAMHDGFVVMKVHYDPERPFFAAYPKIFAIPHFLVLDNNGELLHSQPATEYKYLDSYDPEQLMGYMVEWSSQ